MTQHVEIKNSHYSACVIENLRDSACAIANSHGSACVLTNFYDSVCVIANSHGSRYVITNVYDSVCVITNSHDLAYVITNSNDSAYLINILTEKLNVLEQLSLCCKDIFFIRRAAVSMYTPPQVD